MGRVVGYVRVSTGDQTFDRQNQALQAAAASRGITLDIVCETASGQRRRTVLDDLERQACKGQLRQLWVSALDRIGRSTLDVLTRLDRLDRAGCAIVSLHESIDLTTAAGRLQAQLLASFAEFEREQISRRTKEGLAAARAAGRRGGRPRVRTVDLAGVRELFLHGASWASIARQYRIDVMTLQRQALKNGASRDGSGKLVWRELRSTLTNDRF